MFNRPFRFKICTGEGDDFFFIDYFLLLELLGCVKAPE